ncbi:MAG: hypothetical protein KY432_08355, partial [Acidobacteria bacterium]|nr:hypothetical protein [Acidobacteriota bacterium]
LDEADREAIAGYLDGGGSLWLSSNRAIEALYATDNGDFATDWFGTGWIDIDSFYKPVVFAGEDILAGRELSLEIDSITLRHRLLPLLRGSWVFDRIVVESPRIVLRSESSGDILGAAAVPAALAVQDEEQSDERLLISSITIRNGDFIGISDGEAGFEIEGMRLEIDDLRYEQAAGAARGLSGEGTFSTDSIRLGELIARDSSGPVVLRDGTIFLDGHRFTTGLGEFEAETLEIDPAAQPFTYRLVLRGEPLHVGDLIGGSAEGKPGRFLLQAVGSGPEKHGLRGAGHVHLPGGDVPSSPYLELIESFIGGLPIVGEPWEPTDVEYQIADGRVRLLPFTLLTGNAQLDVGGEIDLEGPLALQIRVAAPRDKVRVDEVPKEVLDLLTDERGRVVVPLVMSGTLEEPSIAPDWAELTNIGRSDAAREAGRKLLDRLDKNLRKLLD